MIPLKHKPKPLHPHYLSSLGMSFVLTELGSLGSKSHDDFYMQITYIPAICRHGTSSMTFILPDWSLTYNTDLLQGPYMPAK